MLTGLCCTYRAAAPLLIMDTSSLSQLFKHMMEAGVRLQSSGKTTSVAILYFWEFHTKCKDIQICNYTLAAACFHVAGKTEEDLLKIRDIINVFYCILKPNEPVMEIDDQYWEIREGIGKLETLVMRVLKFRLCRQLPHNILLHYLKTLQNWINRDEWSQYPIARVAWTILNDSFVRPDLILRHRPEDFAVAVLCLTLKSCHLRAPFLEAEDNDHWWTILNKNITVAKIESICTSILDIYCKD